mmetsp:Transcript_37317/g.107840  ORF Transcript_37317/g.107840 Transcript_37317/m.107840 type:complete len:221 (+) Transcript_37317:365-1027(+)
MRRARKRNAATPTGRAMVATQALHAVNFAVAAAEESEQLEPQRARNPGPMSNSMWPLGAMVSATTHGNMRPQRQHIRSDSAPFSMTALQPGHRFHRWRSTALPSRVRSSATKRGSGVAGVGSWDKMASASTNRSASTSRVKGSRQRGHKGDVLCARACVQVRRQPGQNVWPHSSTTGGAPAAGPVPRQMAHSEASTAVASAAPSSGGNTDMERLPPSSPS